jgi:hypothetical protein
MYLRLDMNAAITFKLVRYIATFINIDDESGQTSFEVISPSMIVAKELHSTISWAAAQLCLISIIILTALLR